MKTRGENWRNHLGVFNKRAKVLARRYSSKVSGCVECGAVAIYRCGSKGYCGAHKAQAEAHMRKIGAANAKQGEIAGLTWADEIAQGDFE